MVLVEMVQQVQLMLLQQQELVVEVVEIMELQILNQQVGLVEVEQELLLEEVQVLLEQ